MPFIKKIVLRLSDSHHQYLDYLPNIDKDSVQYLEELSVEGLNRLNSMRQYFLAAYSFRNSLKRLVLFHLGSTYVVEGGDQEISAAFFLSDFVNLTRLTVDDQLGHTDPDLCLFSILTSCSKLINFRFTSKHQILQYLPFDQNSMTARHEKFQNLILELPTINNESHVKRILSILPFNGLYEFNLTLLDIPASVWIMEQKEESLSQLGKYLENTKYQEKIYIANFRRKEYNLGSAAPSSLEMVSMFTPLASSIMKEGRPTHCHRVFIDISDLGLQKLNTSMEITKTSRCIALSYTLDTLDFRQIQLIQEQDYSFIDTLLQAPTDHNKATSLNSRILNLLEINLNNKNIENSRFLEILESVVSSCKQYFSFHFHVFMAIIVIA